MHARLCDELTVVFTNSRLQLSQEHFEVGADRVNSTMADSREARKIHNLPIGVPCHSEARACEEECKRHTECNGPSQRVAFEHKQAFQQQHVQRDGNEQIICKDRIDSELRSSCSYNCAS